MIFQTIRQPNQMDCGPTCLFMISKYHGRHINIEKIRQYIQLGKEGVNIYGISNAAEQIGFRTLSVELSFEKIIKEAPLPCIVHWDQNHFVVVTPNSSLKKIEVADPAHSIINYTKEDFVSISCILNQGVSRQHINNHFLNKKNKAYVKNNRRVTRCNHFE